MIDKGILQAARCFGAMTVSPRGQVVIPANARKELSIDTGTTLLVFGSPHGQGLVLLKAGAVEQVISTVSERLASLEKQLEEYTLSKEANGNLEGTHATEKD